MGFCEQGSASSRRQTPLHTLQSRSAPLTEDPGGTGGSGNQGLSSYGGTAGNDHQWRRWQRTPRAPGKLGEISLGGLVGWVSVCPVLIDHLGKTVNQDWAYRPRPSDLGPATWRTSWWLPRFLSSLRTLWQESRRIGPRQRRKGSHYAQSLSSLLSYSSGQGQRSKVRKAKEPSE